MLKLWSLHESKCEMWSVVSFITLVLQSLTFDLIFSFSFFYYFRRMVSRLCAGWAVARATDFPRWQWSGSACGDHQGTGSMLVCVCVHSQNLLSVSLSPPLPLSQVLGTPTREQIREMNPNYTEFKFPQIKAHPWTKVSQQVQKNPFLFLHLHLAPSPPSPPPHCSAVSSILLI